MPIEIWDCFSRHFSFFITYELAQKARVLDYIRLKRLTRGKHSSNIHGVFDVRLKIFLSEMLIMIHSDIIPDTDNMIQNCRELENCE